MYAIVLQQSCIRQRSPSLQALNMFPPGGPQVVKTFVRLAEVVEFGRLRRAYHNVLAAAHRLGGIVGDREDLAEPRRRERRYTGRYRIGPDGDGSGRMGAGSGRIGQHRTESGRGGADRAESGRIGGIRAEPGPTGTGSGRDGTDPTWSDRIGPDRTGSGPDRDRIGPHRTTSGHVGHFGTEVHWRSSSEDPLTTLGRERGGERIS